MMGIYYEWFNEAQDIIHYRFEKPWTWDEFSTCLSEGGEAVIQRDSPVAVIFDVTKIGGIARGNPLAHLQKAGKTVPKNAYIGVVVGAPYGVTAFMDVFLRLQPEMKRNTMFVRTLDEALALIQKRKMELYPDTKSADEA